MTEKASEPSEPTASSLGDIRELSTQLSALTTARELAVSRALAAGATWAEVAQVLGCSPQAAHKRYRWLRHSEVTGEVWRESPLRL
ncbi:MAG: hypothetical protein M0Z42_16310 [Actinomycetota bacterium]|jgi:DNA-binding NarL/FixJ family response regulator|nr:hypothetical protein [Actinomycetota bacterium]